MAMDRITQSLLTEFSDSAGTNNLPEDQRFEHFGAFLAVSRHFAETFDTREVVTGAGDDTGLDAIAILVNGALVTDPELVEELAQTNGHVDATFVFIQAKRSASFETSQIGHFGFGVSDFFKEKPTITRNQAVSDAAEIMAAIYARSSKFKKGNPACRLYYMTTGRWTGEPKLDARRKAVLDDLEQLNIFRDIEFIPVGASEIQKFYNQTKNAIARDFVFPDRTVLPEMPGVKEAYLGFLPAKDFVGLLDDGSGSIVKSIFYDNVRDWQDYNAVNSDIKQTLESDTQKSRFVLMNNGVTIIAKSMSTTGNKFHIEDYQIVNGCQTSHVLFDHRGVLDDRVVVPLRLIASDDEEVIASIVKATNRQTEVKEEQLIALSDFQKKLEAYFAAAEPGQRLYYERRSRQYNAVAPSIEKTRIVTPSNLIRAYASIFMNEPHRTTRTYRLLLGQVGKAIFAPDDKLEPYYYAASALYRIEFLFRNGALDSKYKPARYHVLMAARMLANAEKPPRARANEMKRYCAPLIKDIWDSAKAEKLMLEAAKIVDSAAAGVFNRDHVRTEPFTERVMKACGAS